MSAFTYSLTHSMLVTSYDMIVLHSTLNWHRIDCRVLSNESMHGSRGRPRGRLHCDLALTARLSPLLCADLECHQTLYCSYGISGKTEIRIKLKRINFSQTYQIIILTKLKINYDIGIQQLIYDVTLAESRETYNRCVCQ